jgi:alcohol dehydrogenase
MHAKWVFALSPLAGVMILREVIALGAHYYIDTNKEEAVEVIKAFGGAKVILSTITDSHAVATLLPALLPREG